MTRGGDGLLQEVRRPEMFYAALAQSNPEEVKIYEGADVAELATRFARDNGGHYALDDEDATISIYSGKARLTRADGEAFWHHIMSDVMLDRDTGDWFYGEDRAEVERQATAWLAGTLDGEA